MRAELESILCEFFSFFFFCMQHSSTSVISLLFFFVKTKKKRFTWNSFSFTCFFALEFSLECLAHVRAYRDRVRSGAMENPDVPFFYIFCISFFFFSPSCESDSLQGCD